MKLYRPMRIGLITLLLLAFACAGAFAGVVSAGRDFYYLDRADVLSEALEAEIFFSNQLLDQACGAQVVVVTVDSTGDMPIGEYARTLFRKWRIGDPKRDNGFLLLMAIQDADYYAFCGTGLQRTFTADALKLCYEQYLEDDFAAGDYEAGARRFFEAIFDRVASACNANVTVQQGVAAYGQYVAAHGNGAKGFGGAVTRKKASPWPKVLRVLLVLAVLAAVAGLVMRRLGWSLPFRQTRRTARPVRGRPAGQPGAARRRAPRNPDIWQHAHTSRPDDAARRAARRRASRQAGAPGNGGRRPGDGR